MRHTDPDNPIARAIDALGGPAAFMKALGISRRTLFYMKHGKRLSAANVVKLEGLSGIPRHELCPDLWPYPPPATAAAPKSRAA